MKDNHWKPFARVAERLGLPGTTIYVLRHSSDALRLRPVTRFNEPHVVYVQVSDPAFDAHQTDLLAITATSSTW